MSRSLLATVYVPGYPGHTSGRQSTVSRVVIHGTVSPDIPGDALAVARYFQSPASGGLAHYVVDPAATVCCADETLVTWHAPPNQNSVGIELCDPQVGSAARWGDSDHLATMRRAAALTVDVATRWNVPLVRVTPAELLAGQRGLCGHADVSAAWHQSDHTDPGTSFPWAVFMGLVEAAAHPAPPKPVPPKPKPVIPPVEAPEMVLIQGKTPTYPGGAIWQLLEGGPTGTMKLHVDAPTYANQWMPLIRAGVVKPPPVIGNPDDIPDYDVHPTLPTPLAAAAGKPTPTKVTT